MVFSTLQKAVRVAAITQFVVVLTVVAVWGQSQEVVNAVNTQIINSHDRRLDALEQARLDTRVSQLESDMWEVKWMGRTVAALLAGQLFSGTGLIRRRRREVEG